MGDEAELLREAGEGSQQAWDALVTRYGSRVWAVVRAFRLSEADADDVFQTTWLNLVTPSRPDTRTGTARRVAGDDRPARVPRHPPPCRSAGSHR